MKRLRGLSAKEKNGIALETPQNEYYEKISAGLGIFQVVLYLSLFAFVVLSFLRNTSLITYENFYFFFKDLNASVETVDVMRSDSVSYPTSNRQSFTLYRKGLAVAGENAVTVFTATGRQTVSANVSYQNPIAVGAGKYLLVYEMGGTEYSLYNSYTQIYTGKSDRPLRGATVSDVGMYALISDSETHTSTVSLYSSNFSLINRYQKNEFVMDVALDEKGELLALLTSSSAGGLYETKLTLYRPREASEGITVPIGSSLGMTCAFTAAGGVNVLCGNELIYVERNGTVSNLYAFEGKSTACVGLSPHGAAICLKSAIISEKNTVIVFDKSGKMLYNESIAETVTQISQCGDSVFLLTESGILRISLAGGEVLRYECHTEERTILAVDTDEVLLCSPKKAEYIRFTQKQST